MDLSKLRTTDGLDLRDKRVLYRADLNVPMKDGVVTDATRLERIVDGLRDLGARGARVVVLSHFGRPKSGPDTENSLAPVAALLGKLVGLPVQFASDCVGDEAAKVVDALPSGQIAVLENTRFHAGEEKNDPAFAAELAKLGDLYVNDAFSAAHRAHASTEGVTHLLPSYAGPLMMGEINALKTALEDPKRPTAAVVGGAKVSTKIPILLNLVQKVDKLLIGGGMANTFLQSLGVFTAQSLVEPEFHSNAREIMAAAKENGCQIVLPTDAVVAREFRAGAESEVVSVHKVPMDAMILDIGPASIVAMTGVIKECKTLLWNGPMGAFEIAPFGEGTFTLAREAALLTKAGALVSVAGGGDTVAALNAAGVAEDFTYVSSAGGAFLEWLEGKDLPGVAALLK